MLNYSSLTESIALSGTFFVATVQPSRANLCASCLHECTQIDRDEGTPRQPQTGAALAAKACETGGLWLEPGRGLNCVLRPGAPRAAKACETGGLWLEQGRGLNCVLRPGAPRAVKACETGGLWPEQGRG